MQMVSFEKAMTYRYPESVVLVNSCDGQGKPNSMAVGWSTVASYNPPLYAICLNRTCYTLELIRRQKQFVVSFPGVGLEQCIEYVGTHSGRDVCDKLDVAGLKVIEAALVRPPLLADCLINLECCLESETDAGDHIMILGRVLAVHLNDSVPDRLMNFGESRYAPAVASR
jgi:flavin reductase (DIM6/NTAB) family NADH-FMN oxidoreductase RutF